MLVIKCTQVLRYTSVMLHRRWVLANAHVVSHTRICVPSALGKTHSKCIWYSSKAHRRRARRRNRALPVPTPFPPVFLHPSSFLMMHMFCTTLRLKDILHFPVPYRLYTFTWMWYPTESFELSVLWNNCDVWGPGNVMRHATLYRFTRCQGIKTASYKTSEKERSYRNC